MMSIENGVAIPLAELKQLRMQELRGKYEVELKCLVNIASDYRNNITNAKTAPKRDLYTKKMKKVRAKILQILAAIDMLTQSQLTSQELNDETSPSELA